MIMFVGIGQILFSSRTEGAPELFNYSEVENRINELGLNRLVSEDQQFPLKVPDLAKLQRADPLECDEFIAKAMNEEQYEGDASVTMPERGSQRELLLKMAKPLKVIRMKNFLKRFQRKCCKLEKN